MVEYDKIKEFETMGNMFKDTDRGMFVGPTRPVITRIEKSKDGFTTMSFQYKGVMIIATLTNEIKNYLLEVIK